MSLFQRLLGRLPTLVEDLPFPNGWLAHPPGGATIQHHPHIPSPIENNASLRVLTWNIHYGYGPIMDHGRSLNRAQVIEQLEAIAHHIRRLNPDIVALQEVDRGALRSHHIDQLVWLAESTSMPWSAWAPTWDVGWVPYPGRDPARQIGQVHSGQVLLSKWPLTHARRHALPQPESRPHIENLFYLNRCLLEVRVKTPHHSDSIQVFNAHLEAFANSNRELHAQITANLLRAAGSNSVLLGDMNSVPPEASIRHGFEDEPETDMRHDQTIPILRSISSHHEVAEARHAVAAAKEPVWHTFPAHAPNRRLDYIFFNQNWKCIASKVEHPHPPASDHLPIWADFTLG